MVEHHEISFFTFFEIKCCKARRQPFGLHFTFLELIEIVLPSIKSMLQIVSDSELGLANVKYETK